jgi:hypothetical protein
MQERDLAAFQRKANPDPNEIAVTQRVIEELKGRLLSLYTGE